MVTRRRLLMGSTALASGLWAIGANRAGAIGTVDVNSILSPIRTQYDLPAMGGAVVTSSRLVAVGAVGVREYGAAPAVTVNDSFHLGSDTKAMTATLAGMMVEKNTLAWTTTLAQAFPELAGSIDPGYQSVTLNHLLAHQAGMSADTWPIGKGFQDMWDLPGSPEAQRRAYLAMILKEPPVNTPGPTYLYSNRGFVVAGAMAERAAGASWERLMQTRLFKPLGMTTAGFLAMSSPGKIDGPWQHVLNGATHVPIGAGKYSDNPPCIGPAGTVHCSMADWAKYIALNLRGAEGQNGLLKASTIQHLQTPLFGGSYAGGWIITQRPWAGGTVLTHDGSNNQNYATVWMAPLKDFAVLAATNQGGTAAAAACDAAVSAMIQSYTT